MAVSLGCVLLVAVLVAGTHARTRMPKGCQLGNHQKYECGHYGIDQGECSQRGCCWQPCFGCNTAVPWCFLSEDMFVEECLVPNQEKEDCGYYGIDEKECLGNGCCWTPSVGAQDNIPWCYHAVQAPTTPSPPVTSGPAQQGSCEGYCGGSASSGCWCDQACSDMGDCCGDYSDWCAAASTDAPYEYGGGDSCVANCGGFAGECYCDEACTSMGDCCSDYSTECGGGSFETTTPYYYTSTPDLNTEGPSSSDSCDGNCGSNAGGCYCDSYCKTAGDCCDDYDDECDTDEYGSGDDMGDSYSYRAGN